MADNYRYEALPDAGTYLRLLEFEPDAIIDDGKINCRLMTWPMKHAPPYHAASYTWGDPSEIEIIRLNGKDLTVRKNCVDVLRQMLYFQSSKHYWIDAICVNQIDLQEKGIQVAVMGNIFRDAEHVLACIGVDVSDDADYALRTIHTIVHYFPVDNNHPTGRDGHYYLDNVYSVQASASHRFPGVDIHRFISAQMALAERSYFSRVWVMQEFLLARDVTICCGYQRIPSGILQSFLQRLHATTYPVQWGPPEMRAPARIPQEIVKAVRKVNISDNGPFDRTLSLLKGLYASNRRIGMRDMLRYCTHRECEDPRDTIYATLSLIDWGSAEPIRPDYSKTALALAVDFARIFGDECMTRGLLGCLRLDRESSDVLREISLRRELLSQPNQFVEPEAFEERSNLVEFECSGVQLSQSSYTIRYQSQAGSEYAAIFNKNNVSSPIGVSAPSTRLGDWILFEIFEDEIAEIRSELVARWTGSRFAIVGRAWMQKSFGNRDPTWFRLLLDPMDAVVHMATERNHNESIYSFGERKDRVSREWLERLSIGVCKYPFSSFAERLEEEESESDQSPPRVTPNISTSFSGDILFPNGLPSSDDTISSDDRSSSLTFFPPLRRLALLDGGFKHLP